MTIVLASAANLGTATGNFSANFNPGTGVTAKALWVPILQNNEFSDTVTGVKYGGVTVPRVSGGYVRDTIGEPGAAYSYYLGSGIPTGTQVLIVSAAASGLASRVFGIMAFTANSDTRLAGNSPKTLQDNQADPQITVSAISGASLGLACIFTGANDPLTPVPISGYSDLFEHDFGAACGVAIYQTAEQASGNNRMGWTMLSDDVAMIGIAIEEAGGVAARTSDFMLYF